MSGERLSRKVGLSEGGAVYSAVYNGKICVESDEVRGTNVK